MAATFQLFLILVYCVPVALSVGLVWVLRWKVESEWARHCLLFGSAGAMVFALNAVGFPFPFGNH